MSVAVLNRSVAIGPERNGYKVEVDGKRSLSIAQTGVHFSPPKVDPQELVEALVALDVLPRDVLPAKPPFGEPEPERGPPGPAARR